MIGLLCLFKRRRSSENNEDLSLIANENSPAYTIPMIQMVVFLLFVAAFATGQTLHFSGLKWKEKELDHFTIHTMGTGTDPARKFSEKTYEVMLEILPGLEGDFEKKRIPNTGRTGSG